MMNKVTKVTFHSSWQHCALSFGERPRRLGLNCSNVLRKIQVRGRGTCKQVHCKSVMTAHMCMLCLYITVVTCVTCLRCWPIGYTIGSYGVTRTVTVQRHNQVELYAILVISLISSNYLILGVVGAVMADSLIGCA